MNWALHKAKLIWYKGSSYILRLSPFHTFRGVCVTERKTETMGRIGGNCFCLDTFAYKLLKSDLNNNIYHFSYKKPALKGVPWLRNSDAIIPTRFLSSSHCAILSVKDDFPRGPKMATTHLSHEDNDVPKRKAASGDLPWN